MVSEMSTTKKDDIDILAFWRVQSVDKRFSKLALLAKKYLGVPASSASVERLFSIAGHIFSSKRRRASAQLLANQVFLKTNEEFF